MSEEKFDRKPNYFRNNKEMAFVVPKILFGIKLIPFGVEERDENEVLFG